LLRFAFVDSISLHYFNFGYLLIKPQSGPKITNQFIKYYSFVGG